LPYHELGIGALARRVFLHPAGSHFGGVEIALLVGGKPVDAPLAALTVAERPPRVHEVAIGVEADELVRPLVGGPQHAVSAHGDAVNVRRRTYTRIPLVQELAVFIEHLDAAVVAVVDVYAARGRVDRDAVHAVEVAGAPFVRLGPLLSPLQQLLAVHVVLDHAG